MKPRILMCTLLLASLAAAQTSGGSAPAQPPAQQPAPAPHKGKDYKPKTKPEYDAYMASAQLAQAGNMVQAEAGVQDFDTKYPQSELRPILYGLMAQSYWRMDNADKALEMGRKAIALDPDSTSSYIMVATILAERTKETDLDRNEKNAEAMSDAQHALDTIDTGLFANRPPDQQNGIRAMAWLAMGTVELNRKNFKAAEEDLRKATEMNTVQPDAWAWYRYSLALDQQEKYDAALTAINKAELYAGTDATVTGRIKEEQTRLHQIIANKKK